MKYASTALVVIAVVIVLVLAKKEKYDQNEPVVRLPKLFFWVGVVGEILFAAACPCLIIFTNYENIVFAVVVSLVFMILCAALMLAYKNWRIAYDQSGIVYTMFLKKTYNFAYADITEIKESSNGTRIKTTGKTMTLDTYAKGKDEFIRKCRKMTNMW